MSTIDIIVPVQRGLETTRRAIESVLAAKSSTGYELVIVNDASPEPELVRYVRDVAARHGATLIEHSVRQGYAGAVNRAVAAHRDRDVVVLHPAVEVADGWLDRLGAHAREPNTGAVAVFAQAAGIATYPRARAKNDFPEGESATSLDRRFALANAGQSAVAPVVYGPCILYRRECLNAVGTFGGGALGSDYAIQCDFCLRATIAGFTHRVAGDVFVGYVTHASFGTTADDLALSRLYPGYASDRADFMARDPTFVFARRVDAQRLADWDKPLVVFVSHGWGGGIRRHMEDLAALTRDRIEILHLEPATEGTVKLHWPRQGEAFATYFALPEEAPALVSLLRAIGVSRLHFHHVHRLPRAILDLPAAAGIAYDCTLHDYYSICPQYHLVTADGSYCGEPDAMGCAACLTRRPGQWGLSIGAWRGMFGTFLRGAERLIAPSQDVERRIRRYYPELGIEVWPHPEPPPPVPMRVARVVVLGNLSPEKGLHVVADCAKDAKERNLPLVFRVLGTTTEPVPQMPDLPLTILGQYDDAQLAQLVATEQPDVIFFPAQVPETYSYTLTVALATRLPIVASALGAFPERLVGHASAATVPWDAPAERWNAALLAAAGLDDHAPVTAQAVPVT